jgi:hypothetical protein
MCPHVIVRDLDSPYDANTLISHYDCSYVHLGPMTNIFSLPCKTFIVPNLNAHDRVHYFLRRVEPE